MKSSDERHEADHFVSLFVRFVDKSDSVAAGSGVHNPDTQRHGDSLVFNQDLTTGIGNQRCAHVQAHAFGADLGAHACFGSFFKDQTNREADREPWHPIIKSPHTNTRIRGRMGVRKESLPD